MEITLHSDAYRDINDSWEQDERSFIAEDDLWTARRQEVLGVEGLELWCGGRQRCVGCAGASAKL